MNNSIPLNTVFHSPKHRVADNAKRLITLTNLSHFKQVVGALHPAKGLPTALVDQYSIDMNVKTHLLNCSVITISTHIVSRMFMDSLNMFS